jgi:hypothetical protein
MKKEESNADRIVTIVLGYLAWVHETNRSVGLRLDNGKSLAAAYSSAPDYLSA